MIQPQKPALFGIISNGILIQQEKIGNKLILERKKPNSINIYGWDDTGAENQDFSKISDVNLNMPVKDRKKS